MPPVSKGMIISKLYLTDFRNFNKRSLGLSENISVIVGPNAIGKTNVLEAMFLMSSGKSFRARLEEEMVAYNSEISRIKGLIRADNQNTKLEVVLTRGRIEIGENKFEKVPRKKLLVNGVAKRLLDFAGNLKVVLFGPWDLDLVTESPSLRRRFLDNVLSQVDRDYRRASLSYEKGLRQRNKLLWQLREDSSVAFRNTGRARLLFWDKLLIRNGDYIARRREEFIDFVNSHKSQISTDYSLEYDKSAISESRLQEYKEEEIAAATTLVGPHRDDFIFRISGHKSQVTSLFRELAPYGSRGEQRMAVLWLKLAELDFIKESTDEKPVLLLDDIFSELDHEHRGVVMKVARSQQTIITTADPHFVEHVNAHLITLK